MSLLESEAGKRRLLGIEVPILDRYNEGRDPAYRIRVQRVGAELSLRYALKPGHNVYQVETRIPASRASINAIAALHALLTLEMLDNPFDAEPLFTTLLWTMQRVESVFDEPFRAMRFRVSRAPDCLVCQTRSTPASIAELDAALDQALRRLGES